MRQRRFLFAVVPCLLAIVASPSCGQPEKRQHLEVRGLTAAQTADAAVFWVPLGSVDSLERRWCRWYYDSLSSFAGYLRILADSVATSILTTAASFCKDNPDLDCAPLIQAALGDPRTVSLVKEIAKDRWHKYVGGLKPALDTHLVRSIRAIDTTPGHLTSNGTYEFKATDSTKALVVIADLNSHPVLTVLEMMAADTILVPFDSNTFRAPNAVCPDTTAAAKLVAG